MSDAFVFTRPGSLPTCPGELGRAISPFHCPDTKATQLLLSQSVSCDSISCPQCCVFVSCGQELGSNSQPVCDLGLLCLLVVGGTLASHFPLGSFSHLLTEDNNTCLQELGRWGEFVLVTYSAVSGMQ
jgi:hypothetical protein